MAKQELLDAVREDAFVTENALTRVVAQIRHALGDDAKQGNYIETVPTLGYRFVAPVKQVSSSMSSAAGRRSVRADVAAGIVVLPLKNLGSAPQQDYFSHGMTEALTNNLAKRVRFTRRRRSKR